MTADSTAAAPPRGSAAALLPSASAQLAARTAIDPLDVPPAPVRSLGRTLGRACAGVCLGAADLWGDLRGRRPGRR